MDEINKARKTKLIGIIFSIALVLFSIFILGGQGLANDRQNVIEYFYWMDNELPIQGQLDFIWGQGQNMLVVAGRYPDANTDPLVHALSVLHSQNDQGNDNFNGRYQALNIVVHEINILNNNRDIINMTTEDAALFDSVMANIESAANIIGNSSFNILAMEFNTLQQGFPANVISAVRGIHNIELFEGIL